MNIKQEKIPRMILNYLQRNPMAGDTLEGITKWWLELEKIDASVDDVKYALGILMKKGLIRANKSIKGTIYMWSDQHKS